MTATDFAEHDPVLDPHSDPILAIDMPAELAKMASKELAYLQIVPPCWMLQGDPLLDQVKLLHELYQQGTIVWGAVVQANQILFSHDPAHSCPADIVYDPTGRTPIDTLTTVASRLYQLKNTEQTDPELRRYAEHVTGEQDRAMQAVPSQISGDNLLTSVVFIWRPHLPDGMLSMNVVPLLLHPTQAGVATVLPARFWQHTPFYREWLSLGGSNIDVSPAFYRLNTTGKVWQGFARHVYPKIEQMTGFATHPMPATTTANPPANTESQAFISDCLNCVQADYQQHLPIIRQQQKAAASQTLFDKPWIKWVIWASVAMSLIRFFAHLLQ